MKEHRLTEDYTTAFRAFLDHTTEKKDLLAVLARRIAATNGRSLLDIGAGNGDLAIPLSKLVPVYVAIEPKPDYVAKLRQNSIITIQRAFPCEVFRTFDFVIASHVVPWEEDESEVFFRAAGKCLAPSGTFMMITYDEEISAWGELLEESALPLPTVGQGHFEGYKKFLSRWGVLEKESIITYVEAEQLDELLLALSFVYSDGVPERAKQFQDNPIIREVLEARYCSDGRYRFPFTHYLLQVKKIT